MYPGRSSSPRQSILAVKIGMVGTCARPLVFGCSLCQRDQRLIAAPGGTVELGRRCQTRLISAQGVDDDGGCAGPEVVGKVGGDFVRFVAANVQLARHASSPKANASIAPRAGAAKVQRVE